MSEESVLIFDYMEEYLKAISGASLKERMRLSSELRVWRKAHGIPLKKIMIPLGCHI
jgi:hypothetical protein